MHERLFEFRGLHGNYPVRLAPGVGFTAHAFIEFLSGKRREGYPAVVIIGSLSVI